MQAIGVPILTGLEVAANVAWVFINESCDVYQNMLKKALPYSKIPKLLIGTIQFYQILLAIWQ